MKFPKFWQWRRFFNILSLKEKLIFGVLLVLALISGILLLQNFYLSNTVLQSAQGGVFREGLVGQPRFVSPLYVTTEDIDRDLHQLIFSSLLKYDEKAKLVNDLAKDYNIKQEGKVYEFQLKSNVKWHDGRPFTAQDVVFTVKLVQSPQYKSPQRKEWLGVRVESRGDNKVIFRLQKKYSSFLETVSGLKIIPKHLFEDVGPEKMPWGIATPQYLVGTGPFAIQDVKQHQSGYIKEIVLRRNQNWYGKKPFLDRVEFIFFKNRKELAGAFNQGQIDGAAIAKPELRKKNKEQHYLAVPRYFAIFFNLRDSKIVGNKNIRKALSLATDKNRILEQVFSNEGKVVNSPILPNFYGLNEPQSALVFDKEKSIEILEQEGFEKKKDKEYREKTVVKQTEALFTRDLKYGSQGNEVRRLQEYLAQDKNVYPEGIVSGYFGRKTEAAVTRFQEKYAQDILTPIGLKNGTGDVRPMTREKLNQIYAPQKKEVIPLEIEITTVDRFPLSDIAEALKQQWEAKGIKTNINKVSISKLETEALTQRDFEGLVFGASLGAMLDPFPFWHSSQKDYPGLNISGYRSDEVDKLLEQARASQNKQKQQHHLEQFQDILIKDIPAIFIVKPNYVYSLSPRIRGFAVKKITEPSNRFSGIENWYIKTERVWK